MNVIEGSSDEIYSDLPEAFGIEFLDIGNAAYWTASSYKVGHGIDALRDPDLTKYFEYVCSVHASGTIHFMTRTTIITLKTVATLYDRSYAPQYERVHAISLSFASLKSVTHVALYLDFSNDDSYTPKEVRPLRRLPFVTSFLSHLLCFLLNFVSLRWSLCSFACLSVQLPRTSATWRRPCCPKPMAG
jgi:hypothetical protein